MNRRLLLVILMATSHCGCGAEQTSPRSDSTAKLTTPEPPPSSSSPTTALSETCDKLGIDLADRKQDQVGVAVADVKPVAPTDGESAADYVTRHCFVLGRAEEPGDLSRANEFVAEVFGHGYSAEVAEVTEGKFITVRSGKDDFGLLTFVPFPIPQQEAEENADRNVFWPNGKDEAARHRSHAIVLNMAAADQTPVQSAITVSRLALVALKVFDGIGVYWGNGSVCNSRKVFEGFCENMSEKHVPVPMWIRLQLIRASDGKLGLHTYGMNQFGLMEIEVDRCKMEGLELTEWVSDLAHYLIQSGPIVKDEDTVGGSEDQRILVRHRPSTTDADRQVYKIVFEDE